MNPLTHRKDLDDTYERYEELRLGFVKKQENLEKQIVRMQKDSENLYEVRKQSVKVIQKVVAEIKKIQNCPVTVTKGGERALSYLSRFTEAWDWELKGGQSGDPGHLQGNTKTASFVGATGTIAGAAAATLGPTALMAFATTFGTAGTGAAIASLSGVAATNAALAWIGGGTIVAGGAGVAGGSLILSLLGPIGASIAGLSFLGSALWSRSKNNKLIKEAEAEIKKLEEAHSQLTAARTILSSGESRLKDLLSKTSVMNNSIMDSLSLFERHRDYFSSDFPQDAIFTLISRIKLLAKMTQEEIIMQ